MNEATPRITASYLAQFARKNVRIVGKVLQLRGDEATIDAGGQITVRLNRVCGHFVLGRFWVLIAWFLLFYFIQGIARV